MKKTTCTYVLLGLLLLAACKKWDHHGPLTARYQRKVLPVEESYPWHTCLYLLLQQKEITGFNRRGRPER